MAKRARTLQLGKYPRPLDGVFVLRNQPLGEILAETLEVGGDAGQPDTSTPVGLYLVFRRKPSSPRPINMSDALDGSGIAFSPSKVSPLPTRREENDNAEESMTISPFTFRISTHPV